MTLSVGPRKVLKRPGEFAGHRLLAGRFVVRGVSWPEAVGRWGFAESGIGDRVAAAVAKSHPERAVEIYRQGLDATLPRANVSAYESAARYLKKLQPVMKSLEPAKNGLAAAR